VSETAAKALTRVEDLRLLLGGGGFVGDLAGNRCLHAAFVRSSEAHALLREVDTAEARAMPGVYAVLGSAVLGAAGLPPVDLRDGSAVEGLSKTPQPVLAREKVRYAGEPIALVLADDRYLAEDAVEAVGVRYEPLPLSLDAASSPSDPAAWLFDELPGNTIYDQEKTFGDPLRALESLRVFEGTYRFDRCSAVPLEARGCVADYDPRSGDLRVCSSTQGPHLLRSRLAACTGVPEHRVIVEVPDVGGAFGQKIPIAPEEVAVALAAVRLGRRVSWVEDRQENLVGAPQARDQVVTLRMGLDSGGHLLALDAEILGDAGAYSFNAASALIEPFLTASTLPGPYRLAHLRWHVVARLTNKAPIAPYRGVGFCVAQAARELLLDEAARSLGLDRLEIRLANLVTAEEMPFETCNGMRYDSGNYPLALRMAAESALEAAGTARAAPARLGGWLPGADGAAPGGERRIGVGFAAYVEPTGWGSEGLAQVGWDSFPSYDAVEVAVQPSGDVTVRVGTNSQGQGSETSLAELVASILGVSRADVVIRTPDGTALPVSLGGTRASRTAVVTGGALGIAATKVRDEILRVGGQLLEIDPEDLELRDGAVVARGVPSAALSLREVVAAGFRDARARPGGVAPTFAAHEFYDPGATYSSGAIGAVVEVDVETGAVSVEHLFAVEDCGTVLNPTIVEGQVIGGLAQGLGYALLEHVVHDASGQVQTASLLDYLPPLATDVPEVEVRHLCSPSPLTWGGMKGVGEAGMVGGPAAIAAAVADALGPGSPPIARLPITPATIVAALQGRAASLVDTDPAAEKGPSWQS
jgi:carbon-monoxide dehydrogenase large subunit